MQMWSRLLIVCACVLGCGSLAQAAIEIARDGKSPYVIVIADDADAVSKYAAGQLQDYLNQATSAQLPIVSESTLAGGDAPKILIGDTKLTRRLLGDLDTRSLGGDGIVIKSAGGDDLVLTGGSPRGVMYAVDTFLEDHVGVRWWTSSETLVPKKPTLTLASPLDITYVPKFRYREVFNADVMHNAAFAAHLKLNGQHQHIPSEMGGHYSLLGWCHTSFQLIPPGEYFAKHPEWFAMIDGKRQAGTQLCLSNSAMRDELTRQVLQRVRKNPDAGMISVSQNDGYGPCQCDACRAIVKEEGSESGPWIRLVNHIAAEVEKEHPGFLVETLAYVYSRKPPKITRPAKNVLVRLCSIEADFSHPLSSKSNESFGDDLRGWKAIAPNLFIWNYVTNFADYLIPHPNMTPLADDLRFFAAHNVIGVFEQADSSNDRAGDFLPLRTWLVTKLLWDPSQDQAKLTEEFLNGYYGAAGPHLAKYLAIVNAPAEKPSFRMGCYNTRTDFLNDEAIGHATQCFDDAMRAVAGDAELERRVRRERLAIDHVRLLRYDFAAALARAGSGDDARAEYATTVKEWATAAKQSGVRNFSEMQGFDAYVATLSARAAQFIPPQFPPSGTKLPEGQFEFQEDQLTLYMPGKYVDLVDDQRATNKRAARMPAASSQWAVQLHASDKSKFIGKGPWECFVFVRVEKNDTKSADPSGRAFVYGLHDPKRNAIVARTPVELDHPADGEYHAYGMTVDELHPGEYIWVSPPASDAKVKAVYVDRVFIRKQR